MSGARIDEIRMSAARAEDISRYDVNFLLAQYDALAAELASVRNYQASESRGAVDIALERRRQMEIEGYTADHDKGHPVWQFVAAAGAYLGLARWPWGAESFKLRGIGVQYHRDDLARAGAMVAAAIDRLDAAEAER